jgi:pyruvate phosphate dikinase-like enzyme
MHPMRDAAGASAGAAACPMHTAPRMDKLVIPFRALGLRDLSIVGGKNANLGELLRALSGAGVRVPDGFAITADAFRRHLAGFQAGEVLVARMTDPDWEPVLARAAAIGGGASRKRCAEGFEPLSALRDLFGPEVLRLAFHLPPEQEVPRGAR